MNTNLDEVAISKFISFALRHKPDEVGIELDREGWAAVAALLDACARHATPITRADLEQVVANNSKKRFSFSECGEKIRANQGHSVSIDLGLAPQVPPSNLYHGTASRFLESIKTSGLTKQNRQHVHLSAELETATAAGKRHGQPVVLHIDALQMHREGFHFYLSANGVWLTDEVPARFIRIAD